MPKNRQTDKQTNAAENNYHHNSIIDMDNKKLHPCNRQMDAGHLRYAYC